MKRIPVLVSALLLFLLCSCATAVTDADEDRDDFLRYDFNSSVPDSVQYEILFEEYNKYNGRVAMGISGPYVNKDNAVAEAALNCAQMLSFYRGLAMQTDMSTITDDGSALMSDFDAYTIAGTSDSIFRKTAKDMEIVEVIWFGGDIGAAVFATLPEMEEISWNSSWSSPSSESELIIASDTSYDRYSSFKKAIEAAVFQAAKKLAQADDDAVNVNNTLIETTSSSYQNHSYSISGNKFRNFTVLAFRYGSEDGKVHALVAASD